MLLKSVCAGTHIKEATLVVRKAGGTALEYFKLIMSDVTAGAAGNVERLACIYDRRRVTPSGLVGEIVQQGQPVVGHGGQDLVGLGPTSERSVARATTSPLESVMTTGTSYSWRSLVVGTGHSLVPVIVPRAFLT